MSDYESTDDSEFGELFQQRPKAVIEKHKIPDATAKHQVLIDALSPPGSSHSIAALRRSVYDRVETIAQSMRDAGHTIDTIDGCYVYRSGPPSDWCRVPKRLDEAYRSTRHWRALSKKRIQLDGCCTQCKRTTPQVRLQCHHWRYRLFEEVLVEDLQTYCDSCHRRIHQDIKNSGVFFPKYLPQAVIDRILGEADSE